MANKKRPSGHPARRDVPFLVRVALRDYERWLIASQGFAKGEAAESVATLKQLFARAVREGLDLLDPDDLDGVVGILFPAADDLEPFEALLELGAYVQFQIETTIAAGGDVSGWQRARAVVADALTDADGEVGDPNLADGFMGHVLTQVLARATALPEDQRRAALAQVPMVAGIRAFLDWMGPSMPITSTRALRRGDIATVAAMIGLDVVGVNSEPAWDDDSATPRSVQSMWDHSLLSAWWQGMAAASLIEWAPTRVRPGPHAAAWRDGGLPPLSEADTVLAFVIAETLVAPVRGRPDILTLLIFQRVVDLVIAALDGSDAPDVLPVLVREGALDEWVPRVVDEVADSILANLEQVGVVAAGPAGRRVPDLLAGTVARGVARALRIAESLMADDDEDADGFEVADVAGVGHAGVGHAGVGHAGSRDAAEDARVDPAGSRGADEDARAGAAGEQPARQADAPESTLSDDDIAAAFADPQVRADMARLGVVHKPGMAAELLEELAPLLREDGIDLDDLGDIDIDTFNAALARAAERRNLELATPVGAQHERVLILLRLLSQALAEGSETVARIVLDGIPTEADDDHPSVAQVMGVGLGVLDNVHRASAFSAGVARSRIPPWDPPAQAAARDALDFAGQGVAFDRTGELIVRYRGKAVLDGVALAVAATVSAAAAHDGADLRATAERLIV